MKFTLTLTVCLLGLMASVSVAQDKVVFRIVEDVQTRAYPVSQQEALEADLVGQIEARERAMARSLKRTEGLDYAGVMSYGGGKDKYGRDDPTQALMSHGEQRVAPESGFGAWLARKVGLGTSPDDSLPTYEQHLSGVAKVQSLFVAPRNSLGSTVNGHKIEEVASRIALVIHAEENGREVESQPIHITPEELVALTKDPKGALATDLGALIRSTYRTQVLAEGTDSDHTGITPFITVQPVYGPHSRGGAIGTVDESLLNREGKRRSTLSRDQVVLAQRARERTQFAAERQRAQQARIKAALESANPPAGNAEGAGKKVDSLLD